MAAQGGRVVGRAWGEGPTVLLVHGWGGHAGQMTPLVDSVVAAGHRAVWALWDWRESYRT